MSRLQAVVVGALVVVGISALQGFLQEQEDRLIKASLSENIAAAIMQCLPEEVDEVCTIKLVQDGVQLKFVTERHTQKHYGQPVKQPNLKFVVALGDQK